jgi:hypothetical protein
MIILASVTGSSGIRSLRSVISVTVMLPGFYIDSGKARPVIYADEANDTFLKSSIPQRKGYIR